MITNKMRRPVLLAVAASAAFLLGACETSRTSTSPAPAPSTPAPATTASPSVSPHVANPDEAAVQKLLGRWNGPEGIYVSVTEKKGADGKSQLPRKFDIEIADLDGPKRYEGTAKGPAIEFTRNGKTETLKASTGAETGMKGYEKETTCVVVTKGKEGFCKKVETTTAGSPAASPEKK